MSLYLIAFFLAVFPALMIGADPHQWDSAGQLKPGESVRLSLVKRGSLTGKFVSWTPESITVGKASTKREEVLKVERVVHGGWSRGKTAGVGAAIGFGGGLAIGAASGGCSPRGFGPCFSRAELASAFGAAGAIVGGVIGVMIPHHNKELIYTVK